ncbi:PfkB family carbohydrate kinase [Hoeflea ulvae]|uniref:PfkB family carbohydrate kinase n=1 Tax=Hoeflea ulvae TaxID=2983764 RepID=A0ABT3YD21_9HYPH|nr:PfkB family carbohydrate kinase [Hoeflea ulvae]MCY0093784.1 PfkB family carbohydrate kinase [Hoeflea ulvae]
MKSGSKPVAVVVGSLHYDIIIQTDHRPRKGETVIGSAWQPKFGGKGGNQAVAAAQAGLDVRFAGAVGEDDFGQFLLSQLAAGGVDASRVLRTTQAASGMSVAIEDAEGDYGAVVVSGANSLPISGALDEAGLWQDARILILQNELPEAMNLAAARAARNASVPVCLNAAPYRALPGDLAELVDILVVNAIEAEQFCGLEVTDSDSAVEAARRLAEQFPTVVVTAGEHGVVGIQSAQPPVVLPSLPVRLISTHGAGDVFVGTFAEAFARSLPFDACLAAANSAAAAHVSRPRIPSAN